MSGVVLGLVLAGSGSTLFGVGIWRGYAYARRVVAPLVHEGEPTRARIEASRPLLLRPRVRMLAGRVALSIGWLGLGLYGLYLAVSGAGLLG